MQHMLLTPMKILKSALSNLLKLKSLYPILMLLFISNSLFEQFLMRKLEQTLRGSELATFNLFFFGSLNILSSLLFPSLISLFTIFFILRPERLFFLYISKNHIESFIIETLRSWGKMIWWGFLFILPGFYKMITYSYVPFVVLMSKSYARGEIDAIEESERVFSQKKIASFITLLSFQLLLPIMLSSLLDSYRNFNETPLLALGSSILQGMLGLLGFLVLLEIYNQTQSSEMKEGKDRGIIF